MTTKAKNNCLIIAAMAAIVVTTTIGAVLLSWWGGVIGFALFWVILILLRGGEAKVVYNSILPFPRFRCVNICGYLLSREETLTEKTLNHEKIHTDQMREMWYIGFYLWYFGEWAYQGIVRIFNDEMKAYYYITMEQEAYKYDDDPTYLATRERFAWRKYIGEWVKY